MLPALDADSPLLAGQPLLCAAVLESQGDGAAAAPLLADLESTRLAADVALLRANLATRAGDPTAAARQVQALLRSQGLREVPCDPSRPGIAAWDLEAPAQAAPDGPLVSVVVPARNIASLLGIALGSLCRQDHRALEILVVDDASDDGTAAVASAFAARDSRVRLLGTGRPSGTYVARNLGLQAARGEFLTFHDGDDWSHPQKIALQLRMLLDDPGLIGCVSDWARLGEDGRFVARQRFPYVRLNTSSLLLRRASATALVGCFDRVRTGADSEHLGRLRLAFGAQSVGRLKQLLSFASWRADSLTRDAGTGHGSPQGLAERLAYWEGWQRWHASAYAQGHFARLRLTGSERPFPIPASLDVS